MKHSEMLNLNLPEDSDLINVSQISDNFERLDSMVDILPVQWEATTTDIDIIAYPPYWSMTNNTDSDIEYVDHDFWDEKFTIEAGKTIRTNIDAPTKVSISSEVTIDYVYYIPAKEAFSGGGGGGTSDYNKLSNQPKVNGVKLTGDKSAADLGLASASDLSDKISSDEKGASNGIATLDADGKVPQSQLPTPVAQKEYKLTETTSESYAKSYKLQVKNGETWSDVSESASINIPKDMVVESGSVKECTIDNVPVSGYKKGDKYIDLVIANKTDAHIYINVKDLVDNKASGISYSNTTSKLTATTVQAALDEIAGLAKANESDISDVEEKVEKKQNKTFIDSVDSETHVVTVPEGTSFAAVGKICGKTVKDGEVLKSAQVKSVVSCSKNVFDGEFELGYWNAGNDGKKVDDTTWKRSVNYIPVKPSTQYYLSYNTPMSMSSGNGAVCFYDANHNYIDYCSATVVTSGLVYKFEKETPSNCKYITWYQKYNNNSMPCFSEDTGYTPYNKTTVSVPKEILDLPDYGCGIDNYCNWIDFENMVYHHKVKKVLGKDLNFTMSTSSGNVYHTLDIVTQRLICSNYEFANINVTDNATAETLLANMQCAYRHGTNDRFYFKNTSVTTLEAFKESIKNSVIVYAINEELIDISSILYPFPVETGGTITFENEHNLDVQNTVLYKKEVL